MASSLAHFSDELGVSFHRFHRSIQTFLFSSVPIVCSGSTLTLAPKVPNSSVAVTTSFKSPYGHYLFCCSSLSNKWYLKCSDLKMPPRAPTSSSLTPTPLSTSDESQHGATQQATNTSKHQESTTALPQMLSSQNSLLENSNINHLYAASPYQHDPFSSFSYGGGMPGMYGGGGGMYGGMYGGGMYNGMPVGGGPMQHLNQFLFGVQNVIFSLSQAVHIIGMNTEAVQKLLVHVTAMFDHAVSTWSELQTLERQSRATESVADRKRRRRLRALRWALLVAGSYASYRVVHWLIVLYRRGRRQQQLPSNYAAARKG